MKGSQDMKKFIAVLLITVLLIPSACFAETATIPPSSSPVPSLESVKTIVDSMDETDIASLRDYCDEKLQGLKAAPVDEDEEIEASRDNPALVGDRAIVTIGTAKLAVTVMYAFRGDSAAIFAKSFNRYNTSSFSMKKGTEWFLAYLKIEALQSTDERIDLSDYSFHVVTDKGVDQGFGYIADNPLPINSMYSNSTQYCWYGLCVDQSSKIYISIDDGYSSDSYWFDVGAHRKVDTSSIEYKDLKKDDTGDAVDALQYRLVELGYLTKLPSGKYDSKTITAVKAFQKKAGVEATGIADAATQKLLFSGE